MSDDMKKPGDVPAGTAGKQHSVGSGGSAEPMPDDVMTPVDGEIDLARLAPQLRGLYQELLSEPIPDRFAKLLDELSRKETDDQ
jgi:hypothetical protein